MLAKTKSRKKKRPDRPNHGMYRLWQPPVVRTREQEEAALRDVTGTWVIRKRGGAYLPAGDDLPLDWLPTPEGARTFGSRAAAERHMLRVFLGSDTVKMLGTHAARLP